jgi:ABC-type uncharacterized transport system fused permease/ATPase subunit
MFRLGVEWESKNHAATGEHGRTEGLRFALLPAAPPTGSLTVEENDTRVAFLDVTLTLPDDDRPIVSDLTLGVPRGRRLLIQGPSGSGRTTLLRAVAGLWTAGRGRVIRPPLEDVMILPQQPYLRAGRLRDQLLYGFRDKSHSDAAIRDTLHAVGLGTVLNRSGGLDVVADWTNTLSLGEQQRLVFARLLLARPPFAFLDEATSALDAPSAGQLYELLAATPVTYGSIVGDATLKA